MTVLLPIWRHDVSVVLFLLSRDASRVFHLLVLLLVFFQFIERTPNFFFYLSAGPRIVFDAFRSGLASSPFGFLCELRCQPSLALSLRVFLFFGSLQVGFVFFVRGFFNFDCFSACVGFPLYMRSSLRLPQRSSW